ncbi:hypothetical protein GCM10009527_076750 [Actinomadura nitritigenes]
MPRPAAPVGETCGAWTGSGRNAASTVAALGSRPQVADITAGIPANRGSGSPPADNNRLGDSAPARL